MSELYIGVMSGTSLDGVDIVLCEVKENSFELLHSCEYPYPKHLKNEILTAIDEPVTLKTIGELDTKLGKLFADTLNRFIVDNKINMDSITAIGLHGQTLWHEPNSEYPFSMQLGNASIVSALTGVSVVSDFRQKDIAFGGEGAPFAPAFHNYLFSRLDKKTAVLNIGGIANISILREELIGYDTGCGNTLMDLWISAKKSKAYDENGDWANSGTCSQRLLKLMLDDPYFSLPTPKSTGREYFNKDWLDKHLNYFEEFTNEDVQATLLELTATSCANEAKKFDTELLIVCGGGAKNTLLIKRLKEIMSPIEVVSSDECGVSSDFMEAMAFAWLAYKRVHKEKVQLSSVTGAKQDTILGALYE